MKISFYFWEKSERFFFW